MDTENNVFNPEHPDEDIRMNFNMLNDLRIAGQWGMLLAVIGFISAGFLLLFALFFSLFPSLAHTGATMHFSGFLLGGLYLTMAIIYFFPSLFLYRFASSAKKAFIRRETADLAFSLNNLKILFRFMGIFTILSIVLIFLVIFITVFFRVMAI
jgi:hypothetical protein